MPYYGRTYVATPEEVAEFKRLGGPAVGPATAKVLTTEKQLKRKIKRKIKRLQKRFERQVFMSSLNMEALVRAGFAKACGFTV